MRECTLITLLAPVHDALTQRKPLTGVIDAAGLTACASQVSPPPQRATRTVRHALGTAEVPVAPQRIVTSGGQGITAAVLDLGLTVHAAVPNNTTDEPGPWHPDLAARLDGATEIGARGAFEFNLEQVARERPDLILEFAASMEEARSPSPSTRPMSSCAARRT